MGHSIQEFPEFNQNPGLHSVQLDGKLILHPAHPLVQATHAPTLFNEYPKGQIPEIPDPIKEFLEFEHTSVIAWQTALALFN